MRIEKLQKDIDHWIKKYGVRYFDILTNTILLNEEVGEFSGLIARVYGEQSFKKPLTTQEQRHKIEEEFGDVLFVLFCMANQLDMDISEVMQKNLSKKTDRDSERHIQNPKISS